MMFIRSLIGLYGVVMWVLMKIWNIPFNLVYGSLMHFLPHQNEPGYLDSVMLTAFGWRNELYLSYQDVLQYGAHPDDGDLYKAMHLCLQR